MNENKRNEKLGKVVLNAAYLVFALKFTVAFTLAAGVILFILRRPLWPAPVIGAALFVIYRSVRLMILSLLIRFGRNSTDAGGKAVSRHISDEFGKKDCFEKKDASDGGSPVITPGPVTAGRSDAAGEMQMPGKNGRGALFTCPNCGKLFAKTGTCCPFCKEKLWDK